MDSAIFRRIRRDLEGSDVVLYMKGTAAFPLCGFSAAAVQMLTQLGIAFRDINVLEDSDVRQGIKAYAAWPTIPQLYIKGEFVGGCDIMREMYQSGALQALLQEKGLMAPQAARA